MYNESENVRGLINKVTAVLEKVGCLWEVVCVNDGSNDDTLAHLVMAHDSDRRIKIIDFSRNFGKECALSAGINYATGDAVITMDADFQHPSETIENFIEKWKNGADIVFGIRKSRVNEALLKRTGAKIFYYLMGKMTSLPNHDKIGDFCLLDRKVVQVLNQLPENNRFMKGLFSWVGFRQDVVEYELMDRKTGRSKWNYWRLFNFALDGITSFSSIPLRIWTYLGLALFASSILYAFKVIFVKIFMGIDVPGYPSLMVAVLFLGGIQLVSSGILGEYIGRVYLEIKSRPLYVVRGLYGISPQDPCTNRFGIGSDQTAGAKDFSDIGR
jgi:glycosyltransferase involved in cell wall biosynthesis